MDCIGAPDASEDDAFLNDCFVDTGLLDVLRNLEDPRRIVLGRTGSGKTALMLRLEKTEGRCLRIEPESLALPYVSNSTVLAFVSQLGVKLDVFFRLLWRHVFTVELLKDYFNIRTETESLGLWQRIASAISGNREKHKKALEYLRKWGQSFWKETDYRIKELTDTLETNLKAAIHPTIAGVPLDLEAARTLTAEKKQEVVYKAQHVINEVQIRELSEIINLIDDVLDDPQKRYFIVIDRLDENWIDDKLRYLLIRALIETARDFRKVRHAKIVLGLRIDLVGRIFSETRDAGFQEEKYESLFLNVEWTRSQLRDVLNSRVNALVRQRYTSRPVNVEQVLPKEIDDRSGVDYLLDRTLLRPRDAIMLFNSCMSQAVDNPVISVDGVRRAEGEYSPARLSAIADEWYTDYPNLSRYVTLLKGRRQSLSLGELCDEITQDLCLELATSSITTADEIVALAVRVAEGGTPVSDFVRAVVGTFYKVGVVGVKLATYESVSWSLFGRRGVSRAELSDDVRVAVHPAFWRALGISPHTG